MVFKKMRSKLGKKKEETPKKVRILDACRVEARLLEKSIDFVHLLQFSNVFMLPGTQIPSPKEKGGTKA